MAITELVDVVNMALLLVGAKKIDSLSVDQKSAELANLIATQKRDEVFEMPIDWHFATVRAEELTAHSENPVSGQFDYYYALPSNCARFIAVVDEDGDATKYDYRQELHVAGAILTPVIACNETSVFVKYIYTVSDVSLWPAWFRKLVAAEIAMDLVQPLKQDEGQLQQTIYHTWKRAYNAAKAGNAAWNITTDDNGVNLDEGNQDVLNAAVDAFDDNEKRIIERT